MGVLANVTLCNTCQGRVIRATTLGGQPMVVDADPHPEGMLDLNWHGEVLRATAVPQAQRQGLRKIKGLHRAHLASCRKPGT